MRSYYLFHCAILRPAANREWHLLIILSVIGKIFCNVRALRKASFISVTITMRWLGFKLNFPASYQLLCYKVVPTWHLKSVFSFSSNGFTCWSPSKKRTKMSRKRMNLHWRTANLLYYAFLYLLYLSSILSACFDIAIRVTRFAHVRTCYLIISRS